jgi:hypothetical protein
MLWENKTKKEKNRKKQKTALLVLKDGITLCGGKIVSLRLHMKLISNFYMFAVGLLVLVVGLKKSITKVISFASIKLLTTAVLKLL